MIAWSIQLKVFILLPLSTNWSKVQFFIHFHITCNRLSHLIDRICFALFCVFIENHTHFIDNHFNCIEMCESILVTTDRFSLLLFMWSYCAHFFTQAYTFDFIHSRKLLTSASLKKLSTDQRATLHYLHLERNQFHTLNLVLFVKFIAIFVSSRILVRLNVNQVKPLWLIPFPITAHHLSRLINKVDSF